MPVRASCQTLSTTDAPLLARLHATAFPDPWKEEDFSKLLQSPGVTGWRIDDQAFLLVRTVADEAEILTFATHPEGRRRGYARTLLEHCLQYFRASGIIRCFLDVAANNRAAIHLYESAGFTMISRRTAYYPESGEDALVMEWRALTHIFG